MQGVFFRASTLKAALRIGLTGEVRNRDDGAVEIVAEGDEAALRELADWCRHGPPGARVDSIDVQYAHDRGEFATFRVV